MTTTSDTKRLFLFYLAPEFTLLAFTSALETLRLANQVIGKEVYEWRIVTSDGKTVRASCGLSITPDLSLAEARKLRTGGVKLDMAIVCGVTCHCEFPPDWIRVRSIKGRTNEEAEIYGRADYCGAEGAGGWREGGRPLPQARNFRSNVL
ncbi:hypothetical protein [Agrobacterium burrii]|uniref:Uncharacterized protein n=1 Tax=Agrobacterium burrii TaxID=2815339 RepID=A0ABS3EJX5_9HYPH|nr:hypothetical protein [Agrobacterium burrii]MBO0132236.1 hypothetical protein [Agrobacterium burrii]